eukprot:7117030-Prymnesium_polylepis.1
MDTQSHEVHVLRGASQLLARRRIDWIFVELDAFMLRAASTPSVPSSALALLELLDAANFTCVDVNYERVTITGGRWPMMSPGAVSGCYARPAVPLARDMCR